MFFRQAKHYGIDNGYTLSINDALGNSAFLNLLCDESHRINIAFFESKKAELQLLLVELYDLYLRKEKNIEYYRNKAYMMLSDREIQVLTLGAQGLKYREIALKIGIAERTVKYHISHVIEKLYVETSKQAFLRAKELGII